MRLCWKLLALCLAAAPTAGAAREPALLLTACIVSPWETVLEILGLRETCGHLDMVKVQVRSLASIVDLYRLDVGRFPTEEEGLGALMSRPPGVDAWRGPYLKSETSLIDPWGRPYLYELTDNGYVATISSLGADGQRGGVGRDADVSSD